MASDFKTAKPLEYYKQFLKSNIRPDGRDLTEFRKTLVNIDSINTANGSALVRLGHTMVICGIKLELAEPSLLEGNKGFFIPNVELPPSCSPEYRPGPPCDKAQLLSQFVADTVKSSKIISLEDLCIKPKKLCYVVYADIICLSEDGNLPDAIVTALYTALKHLKVPSVKLDDDNIPLEMNGEEMVTIKLRNKLASTTIAIFDNSLLLVDPTQEEEQLSSGLITVIIGDNQQLCSIYKPGGYPLSEDSLKECIQSALNRTVEIDKLLSELDETIDR